MMNRRAFLQTVSVGLLAPPAAAEAQQAGNVHRIGYLANSSATASTRFVEAFRQGLRALGWVEGQNIVIDHRFSEGRLDRLPDLAAELVRLKVDVIVAGPANVAVAAKNATGTIPIVMVAVGDPVGLGLIASLARPGGNVTGLSFSVGVETIGKGLELLKETVPKIRRVAVLSNPANPAHAFAIRDVKVAARSLEVPLQLLEARRPSELGVAFAAMAKERAAALLVATDTMFMLHRARLADLATKNRLPSMHGFREYVLVAASPTSWPVTSSPASPWTSRGRIWGSPSTWPGPTTCPSRSRACSTSFTMPAARWATGETTSPRS